MRRFWRAWQWVVAVLVLGMAPVSAQENLEAGKTPPQIFASDCAACHKTPIGLGKRLGGPFGGLSDFLRQHFTASRETAAVLTKYLESVADVPPPRRAKRQRAHKPPIPKPAERAKVEDKTSADDKTEDGKAAPKSGESKSSAAKPVESKPADAKPEQAKTTGDKSPAAKPAEKKPAASATTDGAKTGGAN